MKTEISCTKENNTTWRIKLFRPLIERKKWNSRRKYKIQKVHKYAQSLDEINKREREESEKS
jgi:hypothetical protein